MAGFASSDVIETIMSSRLTPKYEIGCYVLWFRISLMQLLWPKVLGEGRVSQKVTNSTDWLVS